MLHSIRSMVVSGDYKIHSPQRIKKVKSLIFKNTTITFAST